MDDGIIEVDADVELPYLKHIKLRQLQPENFGYQAWPNGIILSDHWMKKIYRRDIYRDTEKEPVKELENIDATQKKIIIDFLDNRSSQSNENHVVTYPLRINPPRENLIDELSQMEEDYTTVAIQEDETQRLNDDELEVRRGSEITLLNPENIVICAKHTVQPESIIVGKAIEKVRQFDDFEYRKLLKDQHFMEFLNEHIGRYVSSVE